MGAMKLMRSAITRGDVECVKSLLNAHPDWANMDNVSAWKSPETPLMCSALEGQHEICALLIEKGAKVDKTNAGTQRTALHHAALHGKVQVCRTILDKLDTAHSKINLLNMKDIGGQTALHLAVQNGSVEVCECLVQNGADVNARDKNNWTPLYMAAVRGRDSLYHVLMGPKFDVDAQLTKHGKTLLMQAAKDGNVKLCKLLIESGRANVKRARSDSGKTALHYASARGSVEICDMLLKAGADSNCRDSFGRTPLSYAAEANKTQMCRHLIEKCNADVLIADKRGNIPPDVAEGTSAVILELEARAKKSEAITMKGSRMESVFQQFISVMDRHFAAQYTPAEKELEKGLKELKAEIAREEARIRENHEKQIKLMEEEFTRHRAEIKGEIEKIEKREREDLESRLKGLRDELEQAQSTYDSLVKKLHCHSLRDNVDENEVVLNVGGSRFTTSAMTLTRIKPTFLSSLLSSSFDVARNKKGEFLIDRNPAHFPLILDFLRGSEKTVLKTIDKKPMDEYELWALLDEVEFYGITPLIERVQKRLDSM